MDRLLLTLVMEKWLRYKEFSASLSPLCYSISCLQLTSLLVDGLQTIHILHKWAMFSNLKRFVSVRISIQSIQNSARSPYILSAIRPLNHLSPPQEPISTSSLWALWVPWRNSSLGVDGGRIGHLRFKILLRVVTDHNPGHQVSIWFALYRQFVGWYSNDGLLLFRSCEGSCVRYHSNTATVNDVLVACPLI